MIHSLDKRERYEGVIGNMVDNISIKAACRGNQQNIHIYLLMGHHLRHFIYLIRIHIWVRLYHSSYSHWNLLRSTVRFIGELQTTGIRWSRDDLLYYVYHFCRITSWGYWQPTGFFTNTSSNTSRRNDQYLTFIFLIFTVRVYGNLTSYKAQSENREAIEWS